MPPFIEFLIKHPDAVRRFVKSHIDAFLDEVAADQLSEVWQHAAENFALAYAAACLAIRAGILDYDKDEVMRAITKCFFAAFKASSEEVDTVAKAKDILRRHLASGHVYRGPTKRAFPASAEGFLVQNEQRATFTIRVPAFRKWFQEEPGALKEILRWLDTNKFLVPRQPHAGAAKEGPHDWAIKQVTWLDGRSERSIVFFDPFVDEKGAKSATASDFSSGSKARPSGRDGERQLTGRV
ncbi:MAG: hypothetical protein ABSA13_14440 [Beijerinckiaceae bacterium]|jgi:hypothetical protein